MRDPRNLAFAFSFWHVCTLQIIRQCETPAECRANVKCDTPLPSFLNDFLHCATNDILRHQSSTRRFVRVTRRVLKRELA